MLVIKIYTKCHLGNTLLAILGVSEQKAQIIINLYFS